MNLSYHHSTLLHRGVVPACVRPVSTNNIRVHIRHISLWKNVIPILLLEVVASIQEVVNGCVLLN